MGSVRSARPPPPPPLSLVMLPDGIRSGDFHCSVENLFFGLCGFLDGGSNDRITGCFFFPEKCKNGAGKSTMEAGKFIEVNGGVSQHGMFDCRRENYIWLQCNYFCFWNLVATKTSNPNFRCLKMGKWDLRTWLFLGGKWCSKFWWHEVPCPPSLVVSCDEPLGIGWKQ